MIKDRTQLAWLILSISFITFCILAILTPTTIYWYITNATKLFNAEITSVRGTVILGNSNDELSPSLTDGRSTSVNESFVISTDESSQAILTFQDDSSLTMYSNTSIILQKTRLPRFNLSSKPTQITIELQQGRIRATSSRNRNDLKFDINTPYARVELGQGSFSIEVDEVEAQITTRLGQSIIYAGEDMVQIMQGKRAVVGLNSPLSQPLPAAQNMLANTPFEEAWTTYTINPIAGVTATIKADRFQGREVLLFQSTGQDNIHSEVGISQEVNKDVRDFQSVRIFAEVRLINQSLPGGGQLGSEFPIMIHIAYKDSNNNDRDWLHSFYYAPSPENYILYDQPDNSNERIARFIWYPYESVNLLTTLGPAKPVFIKSIRIYSSGWIYEAMIANISLLGQE